MGDGQTKEAIILLGHHLIFKVSPLGAHPIMHQGQGQHWTMQPQLKMVVHVNTTSFFYAASVIKFPLAWQPSVWNITNHLHEYAEGDGLAGGSKFAIFVGFLRSSSDITESKWGNKKPSPDILVLMS